MSDQTITTATPSSLDDTHDPALEHGATDRTYVLVAIFLAVMTALEVLVSYTKEQLGPFHDWILIGLMAVKFFCVILVFMHLKYDPKMAKRVFLFGLGIAAVVYCFMLATFQFWASGFR